MERNNSSSYQLHFYCKNNFYVYWYLSVLCVCPDLLCKAYKRHFTYDVKTVLNIFCNIYFIPLDNCPIFNEDGFIDWKPCDKTKPPCPNSSFVSDEVYNCKCYICTDDYISNIWSAVYQQGNTVHFVLKYDKYTYDQIST